MSSTRYSTDLLPDPALRRVVLGSGVVATLAGLGIIGLLPVRWYWQLFAASCWCAINGRDLFVIARGYKRCSRIRVDADGQVQLFAADGCCRAATIGAGSVVLRRLAWLRLRTDSGRRHAELLRRRPAQSDSWRRLQVIWRHLGAHG